MQTQLKINIHEDLTDAIIINSVIPDIAYTENDKIGSHIDHDHPLYIQRSYLGDKAFQETPLLRRAVQDMQVGFPIGVDSFYLTVKPRITSYYFQGKEYLRTNIDGINVYFQMNVDDYKNYTVYANQKTKINIDLDETRAAGQVDITIRVGFLLTQPVNLLPAAPFTLQVDYDLQVSLT